MFSIFLLADGAPSFTDSTTLLVFGGVILGVVLVVGAVIAAVIVSVVLIIRSIRKNNTAPKNNPPLDT